MTESVRSYISGRSVGNEAEVYCLISCDTVRPVSPENAPGRLSSSLSEVFDIFPSRDVESLVTGCSRRWSLSFRADACSSHCADSYQNPLNLMSVSKTRRLACGDLQPHRLKPPTGLSSLIIEMSSMIACTSN